MSFWEKLFGKSAREKAREKHLQVQKDGIYYCQICGQRKVSLKPEERSEWAVCPRACEKALFIERLSRSTMLMDLPSGIAVGPSPGVESSRSTKFCKWCGSVLPFTAEVCKKCEGEQR